MADENTEIEDAIAENAAGPLKVTGDTGSVEQHPLPDQIEADKYLKSKQANRRGSPLRYFKFVPPGTT